MMTMLTDYILGGVTLLLAARLWRSGESLRRQWGVAMAGSAAAAFVGGTYHGLHHLLPHVVLQILWKATVFVIGLSALLLLVTALRATVMSMSLQRILTAVVAIEFLLYVTWMTAHDDFKYVVFQYAPSLLVVLVLFLIFWRRQPSAAPWVTSGILVSFAAAGVQVAEVTLHRYFDHNDLYHVIQLTAMWLIYRGGWSLRRISEPLPDKGTGQTPVQHES